MSPSTRGGTVREGLRLGGLAIAGIVLAIIAAMIVASMGIFGWGFFQRSTADFRGETAQIESVQANASYRIAQYNSFFDQCEAIVAKEAQIENTQKRLDELGENGDAAEKQRLQISLLALQNSRSELITKYNADAAKADTEANFLASELPYKITQNGETKCA